MENKGVIQKDKLDVTKQDTPDGKTTYDVKSQKPTDQMPVWLSVTVKPDEAKEVRVTPMNKDNTPAGDAKVTQVPDGSSAPITIPFDKPTSADHVNVVFEPKSPSTPSRGDIISVVSCMPDQGNVILPGNNYCNIWAS